MAEINCPLCGKANPDDFDVCQYCQARLKPLIAPDYVEENSLHQDETGAEEPTSPAAAEIPEWLQELRQEEDSLELEPERSSDELAADISEAAGDAVSIPAGTPDWIYEVEQETQRDFDQIEPPPPSPAEPGPEPAALPDWLESIRLGLHGTPGPASSQATEPVESTGPLAGLRGVLAADALISRSRGPATRPAKLRVSANQLVHIDLLRELVESEGKSQPLPQKPSISSEHILRWGIALAVCLAVVWSIIFPGQPAALPALQEETAELNRLIEQLPDGGQVLVAFDYEPGEFAELDAAANAVIDHLMIQGAYLTLVSTTPLGPVLAERFIEELQPVHHYTAGVQYVNLGYIPGGTASLVMLTGNMPRALPYTIEGLAAWGSESQSVLPPLQGIQNVGDYDLVMVLVDDPDVARAWVEQVEPFISSSSPQGSLGMVISAQLEPIIRPYYDANPRQVHGFVAGLRGGASYARLNGREELVRSYWDSFGVGLFMAVLLMLVAGLMYSTYPLLTRPSKSDSEVKG